jgi:hypothetical protein
MIYSNLINANTIRLYCSDCRYQFIYDTESKPLLNQAKKDFETAHKNCRAQIKTDLRKHIEELNK